MESLENKLEIIQMKIKNLQEEFQKENNYFNEINKSIKSLKAKSKESHDKLQTIHGAVQAYQDSLNTLKPPHLEEIPTLPDLND